MAWGEPGANPESGLDQAFRSRLQVPNLAQSGPSLRRSLMVGQADMGLRTMARGQTTPRGVVLEEQCHQKSRSVNSGDVMRARWRKK